MKISMPTSLEQAMQHSLVLEQNTPKTDLTSNNSINEYPNVVKKRDLRLPAHQGKLPISRNTGFRYSDDRARKKEEPRDQVSAIDLSTIKCYNCSGMGHFSRDCTKPRPIATEQPDNHLNGSRPPFRKSGPK